ncbi:MAG: zinc ABC transporter substrate-binding protein [Desulfurococcales archaeon]|nr:zinc ABC transporter substrate-binding protein [Desulfurococcales archaeon]
MLNRIHATIITIILILAIAVSLIQMTFTNSENSQSPLILTTFPGIDKDLESLLAGCEMKIEHLVPSGVDPHDYQLKPSDYEKINSALLIISTGHTPFEHQIKDIAGDKVVEIPEIPNLTLYTLPSGAVNLHMPIYDPQNYIKYIEYVSSIIKSKIPECSDIIDQNKINLSERAEKIYDEYANILRGKPAILSSPASQYAVAWLGVDIEGFILVEHGTSTSPEQVSQAEEILSHGGLAVIIVDDNGEPVDQASSYLNSLAEKYGSPVLKVPAPYLDTSTLDKILSITAQAEELKK